MPALQKKIERNLGICTKKCSFSCTFKPSLQVVNIWNHWKEVVGKRCTPDHLDIVFASLRTVWRGPGTDTFNFLLNGETVCQGAYALYNGLSKRSLRRLEKAVKTGKVRRRLHSHEDKAIEKCLESAPNLEDVNGISRRMDDVREWFDIQIMTSDKMPLPHRRTGSAFKYIIPFFCRKDAFEQFEADMVGKQLVTGSRCGAGLTTFQDIWRGEYDNVDTCHTTRKNSFAACNMCTLSRSMSLAVTSITELRLIRRERLRHLLRQKLERKFYMVRKSKASTTHRDHCLSMIADCGDRKKFSLVRVKGRQCKSVDGEPVLEQSLQTVLVHGRGIFNYAAHPHINGGGGTNYTIECIMRTLVLLQASEPTKPLPPKLYLQLDNCSGSNKNKYMLAFASTLVDQGVFEEVVFSFLMVGHTHEDVDQLFSLMSKQLKKYDIITPERFEKAIVTALTDAGHENVHFEFLDFQHDYKSWLESKIDPNLKYYKKPHVFSFARNCDGKVVMRYKHWHRCFNWYPQLDGVSATIVHLNRVSDAAEERNDTAEDASNRECTTPGQESNGFLALEKALDVHNHHSEKALDVHKHHSQKGKGSSGVQTSFTEVGATIGSRPAASAILHSAVDLNAEVLAAESNRFDTATLCLPMGGSFYMSESHTLKEQKSYAASPGIFVVSSIHPNDVPPRQMFITDKRVPFGNTNSDKAIKRLESWKRRVLQLIRSGLMSTTTDDIDHWQEWFSRFEKIVTFQSTAKTANSWTWRWPRAQAVGTTIEVTDDLKLNRFQDPQVLNGADDSDDYGPCIRHSADPVCGTELRVAHEDRMACEPADLTKNSFIICGRDTTMEDEYAKVKGYTDVESQLPILLCRVMEKCLATEMSIPVTYYRQTSGNVNHKFIPMINNHNKNVTGIVGRSTVLLTFETLVSKKRGDVKGKQGGKLGVPVKRRLAEYGAYARGRSLELKCPFKMSGNLLIHQRDPQTGKLLGIKGYGKYASGHRALYTALKKKAADEFVLSQSNKENQVRQLQEARQLRQKADEVESSSSEFENSRDSSDSDLSG